jgi:hypothetical protein
MVQQHWKAQNWELRILVEETVLNQSLHNAPLAKVGDCQDGKNWSNARVRYDKAKENAHTSPSDVK